MSNLIVRGRQNVIPLTNKSGGAVAAGDVVVVDTTTDESFTTTTTASYGGAIGVVQETIANNASGRVAVQGYVALVNTNASVTRGHYAFTHTVAKQATGSATRAAGAFGVYLKTSATPSAWLFGLSDPSATAGSTSPDQFLGTMPPWQVKDTMQSGGSNVATFASFLSRTGKTVGTVYWACGTSSGNLDFGIYDASLNRLASTGSFASPGTGQRSHAFTGSIALAANTLYYAAWAADNTTIRIYGLASTAAGAPGQGGWHVIGTKATSFPLPDPIATPTWDPTQAIMPALYFDT